MRATLIERIRADDPALLRTLLRDGFDPDWAIMRGSSETALHYAATARAHRIIQELEAARANPFCINDLQQTAREALEKWDSAGFLPVIKRLREFEVRYLEWRTSPSLSYPRIPRLPRSYKFRPLWLG